MANYNELPPEEKEKIKQEALRISRLKKNTNIMVVVGSVVQIIITLAVMLALFLVLVLIFNKLIVFESEKALSIVNTVVLVVTFVGGFYLGYKVYAAVMRFAIKKFNLADKVHEELINRYEKMSKIKKDAEDNQRK